VLRALNRRLEEVIRLLERSAMARLKAVGPPNEWSGSVAAALGKEQCRELEAVWRTMSEKEREEVRAAFNASWVEASQTERLAECRRLRLAA